MTTKFSTHTEGRNKKEVLEKCTMTRNLWEKSIKMDYEEAESRWGVCVWGGRGAAVYTALIWLEMRSTIKDNDDKLLNCIITKNILSYMFRLQ